MGHRVDVSDSVAGFVERVGSSGKEIRAQKVRE